jgi:hypothetical protein
MLGENFGGGGKNFVSAIQGRDIRQADLLMQVVTYLHSRFHRYVSENEIGEGF